MGAFLNTFVKKRKLIFSSLLNGEIIFGLWSEIYQPLDTCKIKLIFDLWDLFTFRKKDWHLLYLERPIPGLITLNND